ncbi:hypothetical protein FHX77_001047 [Bifidobacterium commune]|uniref:Uncharacterized protein n=1 Tax=Bifidobacterium commune TaxID=1505727 RepID=A0A1C4H6W2_9BIFI|nr:hypothetical protein [Bifidobacterium commune]MBB2955596.1 hypothetical protein [Bifidobacterium commune]MBB2955623.1 hypothetical protein [Bifidobacterium commune]SCC80696.1 hypothetical protein GA0061077_1319 [Bifidobacterium commune]
MTSKQQEDILFNIPVAKEQFALMKQAAALEKIPVKDWASDMLLEAASENVGQGAELQEVGEEYDKILATFEKQTNFS